MNNKHQKGLISCFLASLLPSCAFSLDALKDKNSSQSLYTSSQSQPTDEGKIEHTNEDFEGNIWATENANVNLIFTNNHHWSMDTSGIQVNNTNIIVHTPISPLTSGATPTLKLRQDVGKSFQTLELINTGAKVLLWQKGGWDANTKLADSFTLRGTTLETFWAMEIMVAILMVCTEAQQEESSLFLPKEAILIPPLQTLNDKL